MKIPEITEIKDIIDEFEEDKATEVTDVIILGKNGAVRRIVIGEDKSTYFG